MATPDFPIELERVVFTRSVIISVQGYKDPENNGLQGPENDITVSPIDGDEDMYQATMSTKMNLEGSTDYPYIIDMECIGFFRVKNGSDDKVRSNGLLIVSHSVLYGAIREAIAWLTGRQAYGPVSLGLSVLQPKNTQTT